MEVLMAYHAQGDLRFDVAVQLDRPMHAVNHSKDPWSALLRLGNTDRNFHPLADRAGDGGSGPLGPLAGVAGSHTRESQQTVEDVGDRAPAD
jgi:hypothetical protein